MYCISHFGGRELRPGSLKTRDVRHVGALRWTTRNRSSRPQVSSQAEPADIDIDSNIINEASLPVDGIDAGSTPPVPVVQSDSGVAGDSVGTWPTDIDGLVSALQNIFESVVSVVPEPIQPAVATLSSDIMGLVTLHPTAYGTARLLALYYLFFTRPSPVVAILDFYILRPLSQIVGGSYSESDFTLRDKLGNGNYGQGMQNLRVSKLLLSTLCYHR